jgi:hypothetical protein
VEHGDESSMVELSTCMVAWYQWRCLIWKFCNTSVRGRWLVPYYEVSNKKLCTVRPPLTQTPVEGVSEN